MILKKIQTFILDTLFPVYCLYCQKYGKWVCQQCIEKIFILSDQVCPYCEKITSPNGRICQFCKNRFLGKKEIWPLDALLVSVKYKKDNISRLIHCFKYNFIQDLGEFLAKIISKAFIYHNLSLPDAIIPVPLHPKRLRWRGFNQSETLANHISQNLAPGFSIPVISNFIIRKKYTPAQMKIKNYQERRRNVHDIFIIDKNFPDPEIIKNKTILLVDDIATTGATLFEAGKVLKYAGAKKVFAVVIARQEIKKK